MKIFLRMLILIMSSSAAYSQSTISGIVKDGDTNQTVLASIYIPQLERGTDTDLNGSFTLSNIDNGRYKLVISALGYRVESQEITVTGQDQEIEISLVATAIEMEEVIISTPFHNLQSDNVMRVSRVSATELEEQGAATLSEGITSIAGVNNFSTGVGIGKPVIRGLSANRVLTYTQGIRLENQQFGDEHGLGIDEAGISSAEVIKGPASLLYGSDALGGVLYLNPERFANENSWKADANIKYFDNTRGISSNAGFKSSGERFKFLIRGARTTHSDYKTGSDQRVTNSRFGQYDLKTGLQYRAKNLKSEVRYNFNSARLGIPEELGAQTTQKTPVAPYQEIDSHIVSLDNTLYFGESSLDATLGFTHNNRIEFEDEDGEIIPALDLNLNTLSYDVKYNFGKWGKFETIAGVQGLLQENKNFGEEILIPDAKKTDVGLMATTHWHSGKWDVLGGIRFDYRKVDTESARMANDFDFIPAVNRDFSSFNAAFGVKYELTDAFRLRANFASGFRAPNLSELTSNGVHVGTNRYEIGNPDLVQEQSFQTDISAEYVSEHFELVANAFYNVITDYIFVTPTGGDVEGDPIFLFTQANASLYGGEVGFHLHPHPLDWLHLESTFETVTGSLSNDSSLPLIPASSVKNTLRFTFDTQNKRNYGFYVNLTSVFDQNNVSSFETPTAGYGIINLGASTDFYVGKHQLRLKAIANNIGDKAYVSHLSRLKVDGINNIGRSLVFSASLVLN